MIKNKNSPLFLSIPHSGEQIPSEAYWLKNLSEEVLMRDVDRFVDQLYKPIIKNLNIPIVISDWHRYVIDLNRKTNEFDSQSVQGSSNPVGTYTRGLHWSVTTFGEILIKKPISKDLHQKLVEKYYKPFHKSIVCLREKLKSLNSLTGNVFHLGLTQYALSRDSTASRPRGDKGRCDYQ